MKMRKDFRLLGAIMLAMFWLVQPIGMTSPAQGGGFADRLNHRPYDDKLMRLAEVLGAVHYLRELCGAGEKQTWRKLMSALVDSEGTTAKRRSMLVQRFNRGYRGYQRTYHSCTRPATLAVARFLKEGQELSRKIVQAAQ